MLVGLAGEGHRCLVVVESMDLGGLRRLGSQRLWRRWTLASFLARLPLTMSLIALVLAGEAATGSLAVGAQLAGVATVVSGLAAPLRGRGLDRRELRRGLRLACVTGAVVLVAEAGAVAWGAPVVVLFALAAAQGVAFAGVSGGFRALLQVVVPRADLSRANAAEAVFVEVAFVSGPALAGALALGVGPVGVLVVMAGSAFASALVASSLPTLHPPAERSAASPPWRTPGVLPVYGIAFSLGLTVGLFESALPARAAELGYAAASAGPLLALLAAGSGVGGVVATLRDDGTRRARLQATLLIGGFGLLLVAPAATESLVLLGIALFAAGIPIAPLNALGAMLLQDIVPDGRRAEGFAAYIAAIMIGIGAGQMATGVLLEPYGARAILYLCAVVPIVLAVVVGQRGWRARRLRAATA